MTIELRTIDETNREAVTRLQVSPSQREFIATNQTSLETAAQEAYIDIARPFAIYAGGNLIGFTMFAFELTSPDPNDRYWLWRFMIDEHYQGKGFGSAALEQIIHYFQSHGAEHILLSTKDTNIAALSLYRKFRFVETGARNGEETVLRLDL